MTLNKEQERVQKAMNAALSGLEEDPFLARRVLAAQKEEEPMKKLSVSMMIVIALIVLMMSVSLAAGLGLFGELSGNRDPDGRLQTLEDVSEPVGSGLTTPDGVTVEIGQAYYEGDRVFVSYRISGDLRKIALYEGAPEGEYTWDWDEQPLIFAESMTSDLPAEQEMIAWLDGRGQRWAEEDSVDLHDGLYLLDGTYLDIISGDSYPQADGSIIGWKECEIPKDRVADSLEFKVVLFRDHSVLFQDGDHFRLQNTRGESTDIPFALRRNERFTYLKGASSHAAYQAQADFVSGQVDLKGVIRVQGPGEWAAAWNWDEEENNVDAICDWQLYQGDSPFGGHVEFSTYIQDQTVCFELIYPLPRQTEGLSLAPVYSQSGEHPDERIHLEMAVNP